MRGALLVLIACSSVASAQPATSAPPPVRQLGDELPPGAWPGVSLEDVRGMRECSLDDPPAVIGQPVTCRPPVLPSRDHLSFDLAWVTGFAERSGDFQGVQGIALDGAYWLTRSLGVGTRLVFAGVGTPPPLMVTEPRRAGRVGEALLELRWRGFTDEVDRDAFSITIGGGYAARSSRLGGGTPIARVALARDIGYMTGERSSLTWAWEIAGEQALDTERMRLLTASVRAGFELGIREPLNLAEPDSDPPFRYAIGGEFRGSPHVGVGGSFTLPIARPLAWRTTALWTVGRDAEGTHGLRALWAAVTGPRMLLGRGLIAPYVDLQGGPAAIGATAGLGLGWIAEAEGGVDFHIGCQTRLDLGGRIQTRLDDGFEVRTGFFILRVEHGRALRHPAGRCDKDVPRAH